MSFHVERPTKSRKTHKCEMCRRGIPKGSAYLRIAGSGSDGFYNGKAHADCNEMWQQIYADLDHSDGMEWDLLEAMDDCLSAAEMQETLDSYRGHFPHVVCRLEYRLSLRKESRP